ncbi:hypothetical protein GW17_00042634 [Ensete ventricosum]|nr:hypothetical protein GW17_00042634 [Ensete ventricosum]
MQGWPPTARPVVRGSRLRPRGSRLRLRPPTRGRPAMAKAPCRGSRQHARSPTGMADACRGDACGRRQCPRLGRRGRLPAARPQGAAPRPGLLPARRSARRHRPPVRCCPRAATLAVGAVAHADSCSVAACAGQRRRRWLSESKRRGLGYPFEKRMIITL